jgi:hypothetical protein
MNIQNAIIESASIVCSDHSHGALSVWLTVDYGDSGHQGFGGWSLYLPKCFTHHNISSPAGHWIYRCMEIADVDEWDKIVGKSIRVSRKDGFNGEIIGIGHITKDDWFYPEKDFSQDKEAK